MFPCIYDSAQHEILNPSLLDFCRAQMDTETEKNRLFVYRHKTHGTFVIARWASEPKGVFTDFLNLGFSLGNFDREMAAEFRRRLYHGVSPKEISQALNAAESDFRSDAEEKNDEMTQALSKRGIFGRK